jgi:hypothetical protein
MFLAHGEDGQVRVKISSKRNGHRDAEEMLEN